MFTDPDAATILDAVSVSLKVAPSKYKLTASTVRGPLKMVPSPNLMFPLPV